MKLTTKTVRDFCLEGREDDKIAFDDDIPGFGIRLRQGGAKTFVFQFKIGAKNRRMSLGPVSAMDIPKARDIAKDLNAKVRLGQDPSQEKRENKARAGQTFKSLADDFLAYQRDPGGGNLRPHSFVEVQRHLLTHAKVLHELQLTKIERRDIASCIGAVRKNTGAVTGNRVRASLSSMFSWAIAEGHADNNPVIGTVRSEEKTRARVLSPAELRAVWNALPNDHFGSIVKLLALTGQRAGEIAGLRWSEIQNNTIVLPGERTKNHRPHTVPLSAAAAEIITAQPKRIDAGGKLRDLIFGVGEGPFSGWSKSRDGLEEALKENGKSLPHWTPHDLRRSFATHAAEIGIQPHIIEAVLNHVSGHRAGVAGIYNRATYEPEKRQALDRWADQILAWVEGRESNVTTMRRPA